MKEMPTKISCENRDPRFCPSSFEVHDSIESTLLRIAHNKECHDIPHVTRMEVRGDRLLVKGGGYYTNWIDRPLLERDLKLKATSPSKRGGHYVVTINIPDQVWDYS